MNDENSKTSPAITQSPQCGWCGGPVPKSTRKGRTRKFCSRACYVLAALRDNLVKSKWTPERQALLQELWPEMSAGEIAKRLGMTRGAVMGRLNRQGQLKSEKSMRRRTRKDTVRRPTTRLMRDKDFIGCRWIEGDPLPLRSGMYCCAPLAGDSPYCAHHYKKAHARVSHDEWNRMMSAAAIEREAA